MKTKKVFRKNLMLFFSTIVTFLGVALPSASYASNFNGQRNAEAVLLAEESEILPDVETKEAEAEDEESTSALETNASTNLAERGWKNTISKAKSEGLNVVFFGDSITAGTNAYLGKKAYMSYANFLAQDMRNAGVLKDFKNFAISGAEAPDIEGQLQSLEAQAAFKNADLVTFTIGGNDILAHFKILGIEYAYISAALVSINELVALLNSGADLTNLGVNELLSIATPIIDLLNHPAVNKLIGDATTAVADAIATGNSRQIWNLLFQLLEFFANEFANKRDFGAIATIDMENLDGIFAEINAEVKTAIEHVAKAAPNANIMLLGPFFPFQNVPLEQLNKVVGGENFLKLFNRYAKEVLEGATKDYGFVRYQSMAEIPDYYGDVSARPNSPTDPTDPYFRYRKIPSIADIHPSTYGHQLIGNGLFKLMASHDFGIDPSTVNMVDQIGESIYDEHYQLISYELLDEDPTLTNMANDLFTELVKTGANRHNFFLELINIANVIPDLFNVASYAPSNGKYTLEYKEDAVVAQWKDENATPTSGGGAFDVSQLMVFLGPITKIIFGGTFDINLILKNIDAIMPVLDQFSSFGGIEDIGDIEDAINNISPLFNDFMDSISPILSSEQVSKVLVTLMAAMSDAAASQATGYGGLKEFDKIIKQDFMKKSLPKLIFTTNQYNSVDAKLRALIDSGQSGEIDANRDLTSLTGFENAPAELGVKTFGELITKYEISSQFQSLMGMLNMFLEVTVIDDFIPPVVDIFYNGFPNITIFGLLEDTLAIFMAKNGGRDFFELYSSMNEGLPSVETLRKRQEADLKVALDRPELRQRLTKMWVSWNALTTLLSNATESPDSETLLEELARQPRSENVLTIKNRIAQLEPKDLEAFTNTVRLHFTGVNIDSSSQATNVRDLTSIMRYLSGIFAASNFEDLFVNSKNNMNVVNAILDDAMLYHYLRGGDANALIPAQYHVTAGVAGFDIFDVWFPGLLANRHIQGTMAYVFEGLQTLRGLVNNFLAS